MARLAARRTRSPESDEDDESRPPTPLSTAPDDRKRARRSTRNDSDSDGPDVEEGPSQRRTAEGTSTPSGLPLNQDVHHQPGAIVRVKLVNFVTYTKAEFLPGPSLNMVIGPNGTGKSTLVCAICLGLGWGPQFLGRAKDLGEFVKHGAREATIEIELKRAAPDNKKSLPTRKNPVITRRIIKDGNKSSFSLNGRDAGVGQIKALAQKFDIQIDNLCQFLPQDRVVEFAQMKPHEVLLSTQQAAGTSRMVECYNALLSIRSRQKELIGAQRTDRDELDNLKRRHEAQRIEVDRERESRTHKQKLEHLQRAKVIPEFNTAKITATEAKTTQKRLARELQILQDEVAPTLRKVNAKQAYKNQLVAHKKQREGEAKAAARECDNVEGEINEFQTLISDYDSQIRADRDQVKTKATELRKHLTSVTRLKDQRERAPPEFDTRAMNEEISDRNREITDVEADLRSARERRDDLGRQIKARENAIEDKEKQLGAFDTQTGRRENWLRSFSEDTAKAWQFIKENRTLFEKHVFGPPGLECTVENKNMTKAVESMLQPSDFRIITAQTKNDYVLLQQKLNNELNLHQVSLRLRFDDDLSQYEKPFTAEELRQHGLQSYVIDHIQGPPVVLAMLCSEKKLHQCAIASRRLTAQQHDRLKASKMAAYYADGQIHRFLRREDLGPHASMSSASLARDPWVWTDRPVDLGRKAGLQRDLAEARGELKEAEAGVASCNREIQQANAKVAELKGEVTNIRNEKIEKQNQLAQWNALPQKIEDEERKAADVQNWLDTARDRREEWTQKKDEAVVDRAEAAVRYADCVRALKEAMQRAIEAEVMLAEATSDYEILNQRNTNIKSTLAEKQAEERTAADKAKTAHKRSAELFKQAQNIAAEAKAEEQQGKTDFVDLINEIVDKKWTPADWEAEVETVNANIALTEGGSGDAIRQFEEREKKIEVLEQRLAKANGDVDDARKAITEVRVEWEPLLDALVAKISDAFADSFARIGCAGQVEVHKASSTAAEDCTEENGGQENGLDFANWAVHISVKFRENEPLSLLDSHRQSGGERAVSTIFYLMALQSLSRAPFRVVDEINQGMDGRNERMVHGRMVDVATATREDGGQGSQYFLITPKLLSGLKYKRGMTVLCIVSGEQVPGEGDSTSEVDQERIGWRAYPRLDFSKLAARARGLDLARLSAAAAGRVGRRVDSGVAMAGA